jgi:adenine-specific DNA-methyltransferase
MTKKQKLDLTWLGEESQPRLEPRILIAGAAKGYRAAARVGNDELERRLHPLKRPV